MKNKIFSFIIGLVAGALSWIPVVFLLMLAESFIKSVGIVLIVLLGLVPLGSIVYIIVRQKKRVLFLGVLIGYVFIFWALGAWESIDKRLINSTQTQSEEGITKNE